jgi:glycoside/pentoside/hexuronide:cation symporter, GPH family
MSATLLRSNLLAYALPWLIIQVVQLPLINFVPGYYASDLGMPLFTVSFIMLAGRLLDIIVDPLIGILSDRTRHRFGRRKTWIVGGAPILILGCWLLFVPPANPSPIYLFGALAVAFLGFAMVQIPYSAWGAELSTDYDARSRIVGWRESIGVLGTLCAISSPLIAAAFGNPGLAPALFGLAIAATVLLPLFLLPALAILPDEAGKADAGEAAAKSWKDVKAALSNRSFLWFVAACFLGLIGVAPGGATGYLMMKHYFGAEDLYPYLVVCEFVAMLVFIPFWVWLSGRMGKHRAVAFGALWMAFFTAFVPFVPIDQPEIVLVLSGVRGIGFGAVFAIPYAILADVIDSDTLRDGQQRSGLFTAIATMNAKFGLMVGVSLALAWPAWFGFSANPAENLAGSEFQITVSYAWLTSAFLCLAVPLFWFFPLDRARQLENQRLLEDAMNDRIR